MDDGENVPHVQEEREEQQVQEAQYVLKRSTRQSRASSCYVPSLDYVILMDCKEPIFYEEAMFRDDKLKWEKAVQSKLNFFHKNSTWKLVHLLATSKRVLPYKWVHKLKVI